MSFTDSRTADQTTSLCTVVVFSLFLSLTLWTVTYRGLYADGSNLLLNVIELRNFYHVSATRFTSTFMTQGPVVLAIWLGVRSMVVLSMVYTVSLAAIPVVLYSLALWLSRWEPALFSATVFVIVCCFYPVSFLLVGEINIYIGLFWLAFVILLGENTQGKLLYDLVLLLVSIAALEVYETSAVFSAILAVLSGRRAMLSVSPASRFLVSAAAILFVFGSVFGILGVVVPRSAENESGFAIAIHRFADNAIYLRLLAIAAVAALASFIRLSWARFVVQAALFVAIGFFVTLQLRPTGRLALGYAMDQRAQVQCALAVIVGLLLLRHFLTGNGGWPQSLRAGILVAPLIGVVAVDTVETVRWTGFVDSFCKQMAINSAARHSAFFAEGPTRRYGVNWTFPTMSVVLGGKTSRVILAKPGFVGWQPFVPQHPPDIHEFKSGQTICP